MTCEITTIKQEPDYFPSTHDTSGKLHGPFRFLIKCDPGVQPTAYNVIAVDELNYPLPFDATGVEGDSLVVSNVSLAMATDQTDPNVWGVLFYVRYGSPKVYRMQCRYDLNTTPVVGDDVICLLVAVK